MIAPPPHLRTDDQITGYFRQAAEAIGTDIPWVLQDYPLTLTVVMTPQVIRKIVTDNPSCVMLKHEDFPGMRKLSEVRSQSLADGLRRISVLVGNGGLFLPQEMLRGADGAMTGFAYPEMLVQACALFDAHQPCGAQANMAKLLAADASWEAANACLQFHGGFGFAAEYDVERKFRETRLYQVAPISTNMILSYVAEHVLGLPRSY